MGDSISIQYGPFLEAELAKSGIAYGRKGGEGDEDDLDNPTGLGANGGDSTMLMQCQSGADPPKRPTTTPCAPLINHPVGTPLQCRASPHTTSEH